MPVSAETAARSEVPPNDKVVDEHSRPGDFGQPGQPHFPSETVEPTQVTAASQQGATQPDSGKTVLAQGDHQPTFKEKVIGYAKEVRGTALNKQETKEQGQRIIAGQEAFETKKVGPKS